MKTNNSYKGWILFLTVFLICLPASAQPYRNSAEDQRTVPHFGLKAGINISNIYDTESEDLSDTYKAGFAGGVFLSLPLGTIVGIQPELIYSKKGYVGKGRITDATYRYARNFDYLDLPVRLQIKPSENITLLAGPVVSWLLNKRFDFRNGTISLEQQTAIKNSNIRKNTFGLTGGLDFNLYPVVLSGRVGFDLRDNNGDGTSTDPRFKNAWFQATFGVAF